MSDSFKNSILVDNQKVGKNTDLYVDYESNAVN